MAKLAPEDRAPPREAWAMRWLLIGVLLLGIDVVLNDRGDLLSHLLAERVVATADIRVLAQTDDRVEEAFARAQEAEGFEAGLNLTHTDDQARTHQVWLTAPNRDQALAQLERLLARFHEEYGGDAGGDLWIFSSPYVPPLQSPRVQTWGRRIALGLLLLGLAALAAGARLFLQSSSEGQARMRDMLFGEPDDDVQASTKASTDDDDAG